MLVAVNFVKLVVSVNKILTLFDCAVRENIIVLSYGKQAKGKVTNDDLSLLFLNIRVSRN